MNLLHADDQALTQGFQLDPVHERMLMVAIPRDGRAGERWRALRRDIDLDTFWDGKALDLLPLVFRALVDEGVDDPDLPRLRGVHRRTWYANHMRFESIAGAVRALQRAGVDSVLLKGSALAVSAYPDVGLRPMHDSDLLIRPAQLPHALAALTESGWTQGSEVPANFALRQQEVDLRDSERRVLDLHWHINQWLVGDDPWTTEDQFIDRSVPIEIAGTQARALDPTDTLLHLVLHAAWAGWRFAPQWVPDAVLVVNDGSEIEWGRLAEIARQRRVTLPVRRALDFLSTTFRVPVPATVLAELDVSTSSRSRRAFTRLGQGSQPTPRELRWQGPLASTCLYWRTQTAPMSRRSALRVFPGWLADHWQIESPWALPNAVVRRVVARLRAAVQRRVVSRPPAL